MAELPTNIDPVRGPIGPSMYEVAIQGREKIAHMFGKRSVAQFWAKHGKELHGLGIVFYIQCGNPRRLRIAAFQSELIKWAQFKAAKREII